MISACFGELGQCAAVISACGEVISACATVISACIASDLGPYREWCSPYHHQYNEVIWWYSITLSCCKNMQCIKNLWRSVVISFRSSCCKNMQCNKEAVMISHYFVLIYWPGLEFSQKWVGASRAPTFQNLGARHKKWGPCNKCTFKSHCNYNFIQHSSHGTNIMAVAYVAA